MTIEFVLILTVHDLLLQLWPVLWILLLLLFLPLSPNLYACNLMTQPFKGEME